LSTARGVVASGLAVVLLGGCFDGCRDITPSVDAPVEGGVELVRGPPAMSVGTLRGLGSHVWEASFELRGDRAGVWPSRDIGSKLIWSELDFWEFEQVTGGALRRERQVDRDLYRQSANDSRWIHTSAPAGNSLILRRSLQLWEQAMTGFGPQIAWRDLGEEVLEGRPVRVLRVELAPLPAPDGPLPVDPRIAGDRMGLPTTPLQLTGTVYVDLETGNRLLAEVDGVFIARAIAGGRDPTDEVHVTYREKRTLTTLPPTVSPPAAELIITPQRRPRSPNTQPIGSR
jgi:hypothetical protein